MNQSITRLARGYRKLGFQPDSADELPARREVIADLRHAGSVSAKTGKMPILRRNR
jgi:hypothetical protein